jgi:DNA-binding GntR family transcriptional regulator
VIISYKSLLRILHSSLIFKHILSKTQFNELPAENIDVADVVPGLENYSEHLRNHGLYETLEKHYKLEMGIAFKTISVIMSNDFMNDLFGTNAFVPLFKNERITKLTNGKVFESVTSYIRTENFNYSVILNGRK